MSQPMPQPMPQPIPQRDSRPFQQILEILRSGDRAGAQLEALGSQLCSTDAFNQALRQLFKTNQQELTGERSVAGALFILAPAQSPESESAIPGFELAVMQAEAPGTPYAQVLALSGRDLCRREMGFSAVFFVQEVAYAAVADGADPETGGAPSRALSLTGITLDGRQNGAFAEIERDRHGHMLFGEPTFAESTPESPSPWCAGRSSCSIFLESYMETAVRFGSGAVPSLKELAKTAHALKDCLQGLFPGLRPGEIMFELGVEQRGDMGEVAAKALAHAEQYDPVWIMPLREILGAIDRYVAQLAACDRPQDG